MDWAAVHRQRMDRHLLTTGERPDPTAVAHRVGPTRTTEGLVYRKGGWVSPIVVYRGLPIAPTTQTAKSVTVEPFDELSAGARKALDAAVANLQPKSPTFNE